MYYLAPTAFKSIDNFVKGFEVAAVKDTAMMKRDGMVDRLAAFLLAHFVVLLNLVNQPLIDWIPFPKWFLCLWHYSQPT